MKAKPRIQIEETSEKSIPLVKKGFIQQQDQNPIDKEWGIINPFRKEPKNNDRCGINREKNPCGDASDY